MDQVDKFVTFEKGGVNKKLPKSLIQYTTNTQLNRIIQLVAFLT